MDKIKAKWAEFFSIEIIKEGSLSKLLKVVKEEDWKDSWAEYKIKDGS